MEVFKIVGFAIFAVVMIIVIKEQKPEIAIILAIATGIGLMFFAISKMSNIVDILNLLISKSGINSKFLEIILKVTAIAYIIEFGKNICIDAGQSAVATKLEMAGKVIIITLSLPLINSLLDVLTGLV
jgi:stage III sporulation protein AD